jgi:hypothetical protein
MAEEVVDLDAEAARYTALEDPNIVIRTWY